MNYTKKSFLGNIHYRENSANNQLTNSASYNLKQSSSKTRNTNKVNNQPFLNYKNLIPVSREFDDKSSFKVFHMIDKKSNVDYKNNSTNSKDLRMNISKNNSAKNVIRFNSKENLNTSKEYSFILSEYKKNNNRNNCNIPNRQQSCSNFLKKNEFKYVKKVINNNKNRPIEKFINIKNESNNNISQDLPFYKSSRLKLLEKEEEKKNEKNRSFIEEIHINNKNKFHSKLNYAKYISNSKNKKKAHLEIDNSSSFLNISNDIPKNSSNIEDIFTFNSARMRDEEIEKHEYKDKTKEDINVYRTSGNNHKRNKVNDENYLFYLSLSGNHNQTYSSREVKKFLSKSFKELIKNPDITENKKNKNESKNIIKNSFTNEIINISNNKNNDVDTVEELHYVFVRFYQKNKDKIEKKTSAKLQGNTVVILDEQDIN